MGAKVTDPRAVIASGLYWASVETVEEADYLCAILNAPVTTEMVRPFMSYGKDERDIHKHVWEVPVPIYDPAIKAHRRLSELGKEAEDMVGAFPIDPDLHFATVRRRIRAHLDSRALGQEINEIAFELLG